MDMQIQRVAIIRKEIILFMKEIEKKEMLNIEGGDSGISGSVLSAIYKIIDTIYSIGESFGSYIRRVAEDKMCDI